MRIIQVQLNCGTQREYYRTLGNLLVVQKLLNDYLSSVNEEGIGPEGFAEDWIKSFGLTGPIKDEVLEMFCCALLVLGRSGA